MADSVRGSLNGYGRPHDGTSPGAVQAEYERRALGLADEPGEHAHSAGGRDDDFPGSTMRNTVADATHAARPTEPRPDATVSALKDQATEAAIEARRTVLSLADEARARFSDLVDRQKALGADKLAGLARAADAAAADLDKASPEVARIVRSAAAGAERIADDVRSRSLEDILRSVSDFGRRQPVAFFGSAVLAGFVLARFFKTDVPKRPVATPYAPRGDI
jgi:hypothetical protein